MTRVAVIGGARTPFVKAGGAFADKSFLDLGIHAVKNTVERVGLDPEVIDELIFGTVLLDPRYPNAARELVLRSDLPKSLSAHFISNNCISGLVAVNMITEGIKSGRIQTGVAGGSESMSNPSLTFKRKTEKIFLDLSRARSLGARLGLLAKLRPGLFLPVPPSPKEPSTGMTMGQHCEISTKEFSIGRVEQDELALRSHQNGSKAQEAGILAQEIAALGGVDQDNIIRSNTSLERLAKLRPVFDRSEKGTLTAGNSSPLTDGASAIYLMAEDEARVHGKEPIGFIEAVEFAAIDPSDGLLMAPGVALPRLLEKNGLNVSDVDYFEVHEAFAAQVLANREVWKNGWDKYPSIKAIGEIPEEKINVNGSSIAIGHPFAATGARLVLSAANQLQRSGKEVAVISVCAAGGMACAMLIRRS